MKMVECAENSLRTQFIVKMLEISYGGSKAIPLKAKALSFLA